MRDALDRECLASLYARVAQHYDRLHAVLTLNSDQRGRRIVTEKAVRQGDRVLDCGAGTGSTALLAAQKSGPAGHVVLVDVSDRMLAVAREKAQAARLENRLEFLTADMVHLPFPDSSFDSVLSTYSLCPLCDPSRGGLELYRVVRPGGRIGVAHSVQPPNALVRWVAERIESAVWHFPSISLGCRPVSVLPVLERVGTKVIWQGLAGVPLWPFMVFILEKATG